MLSYHWNSNFFKSEIYEICQEFKFDEAECALNTAGYQTKNGGQFDNRGYSREVI